MLLLPFTALFLRVSLYADNSSADVSFVLGVNFVTSAVIVLIVWLCWLNGAWESWRTDNEVSHNHWTHNREYFSDLGCYVHLRT